MRQILVVGMAVFVLGLAGCGFFEREVAKATGYSRMCIDGVSYLQFTSGASVEYTREGKVKNC